MGRTVTVGRLVPAALLLALLTACTSSPPTPAVTPSGPAAVSDGAAATPTAEPVFVAGGTSEQNRASFDRVTAAVVAADPEAGGDDFVSALIAAGFAADAIEVTADETTVGLDADSVQFAVRTADGCLLGQYGSKSDGLHSMVAAPIATGTCLIGGDASTG